jgi:uncharacterized protein
LARTLFHFKFSPIEELDMPITTLFASLLALLFVFLSVRVIGARRGAGVAIGDGGDKMLARRVRVHGNFAEYVPMGLLLMALAESGGVAKLQIWLAGALLLVGRAIHAYGVSQDKEVLAFRVTGMAMTFTAIVLTALACLFRSFPAALQGGIGW